MSEFGDVHRFIEKSRGEYGARKAAAERRAEAGSRLGARPGQSRARFNHARKLNQQNGNGRRETRCVGQTLRSGQYSAGRADLPSSMPKRQIFAAQLQAARNTRWCCPPVSGLLAGCPSLAAPSRRAAPSRGYRTLLLQHAGRAALGDSAAERQPRPNLHLV
ncbi:hypothetical protein PHYPSEUDO_002286 [Phytophthora pseudosyringae]|uniref:Uncharacterized protein n=1 Tax=Phytophthora pseudosyringae TaxID=221518 RepID=A0A8T1V560_9STRA|nr:hypothetical protein PHYPSEUDO_002286 [Phytophthora pseudosyringae]